MDLRLLMAASLMIVSLPLSSATAATHGTRTVAFDNVGAHGAAASLRIGDGESLSLAGDPFTSPNGIQLVGQNAWQAMTIASRNGNLLFALFMARDGNTMHYFRYGGAATLRTGVYVLETFAPGRLRTLISVASKGSTSSSVRMSRRPAAQFNSVAARTGFPEVTIATPSGKAADLIFLAAEARGEPTLAMRSQLCLVKTGDTCSTAGQPAVTLVTPGIGGHDYEFTAYFRPGMPGEYSARSELIGVGAVTSHRLFRLTVPAA